MNRASPPHIVLASQSPRRRELAENEGWTVDVRPPPEATEAEAPPREATESLEAWVARLAHTKASAVIAGLTATCPPRIVLACDTIGVIDDEPLGKPADRTEAAAMLSRLSGRVHRVLTGSCLWPVRGFARHAVTESILEMPPLSPSFINDYLQSGLWEGKAGACGFQDGVIPLRLIAGSGSNVIGLPLETLRRQLAEIIANTSLPACDYAWFPAEPLEEPSPTALGLPPSP